MFGEDPLNTTYLVECILHVQGKFKNKARFDSSGTCTLEVLLGFGDSWKNMACIDKLVELGYIAVVNEHEACNYRTYRNCKL